MMVTCHSIELNGDYAYSYSLHCIEFKKMWSEIPVPDETDLPRELENGMYSMCMH
jgi:hypothetical protein